MRVDAVRAHTVLLGDRFAPATLVVEDGRIAAVEPFDHPVAGGAIIEAPDTALVLPGAVDIHVHVNEPGRTEWEGFASATRAAALGGVTTIVDMPLNSIPPTTTVEALRIKQHAARDQLTVDVGFWGGAVPGNLDELEPLWDAGVFGFKCFLAPSGVDEFAPLGPDQFRSALEQVAALGALMIVHAEDAGVLAASPAPPSRAYRDFLLSRPDHAETAAIEQVIRGARDTGARVHMLHLSSARSLDVIADARAEGLPVTVETCPHYLCFAAEDIPDAAARFKCCPPIRDAGNREALWQALVDGIVDAVVSDHSPATAAEKDRGGGDLQQAWGGIAGLQVGFAVVAHEARRRGIGIEHVSRWMSTSTADLVGLRAKGRIEVGADADLAVYDPVVPFHVAAARLAHRNPISAYDGLHVDGRVVQTIVRGNLVGAGDSHRPGHGWGRMLNRA